MNTKIKTPMRSARGFTLIELMITVSIIAILSGIAYSSYTRNVKQSRRTEAKAALLDLAGREERFFSTMNRYTSTPSDLRYGATTAATFPMNIGSGFYSVNVTSTATTYSITATAIGAQAGDAECATLTVDQAGTQSATGTAPAKCW